MRKPLLLKVFSLVWLMACGVQAAFPCSMYKLTAYGKTMVGNNEDSWGLDARIWFEPRTTTQYGVAYVGYARKHPNPDGAVNEFGLAFDAFTMPHRAEILAKDPNKRDFGYGDLRTIMQQCKTVDEVYAFLSKRNLHVLNGSAIFNGAMLLFVDKTGKYLVAEAHQLSLGSDDKFLLANFSFADTKDLSSIKAKRYCNGVEFLKGKRLDSSLAFCTALSDTMSVNRAKAGDGTLYTSIYNLQDGLIHLYFFHDYHKCISFNLAEELAKGSHEYRFAELFPHNAGYERFLAYKTPQNSPAILAVLVASALLLLFAAAVFGLHARKTTPARALKLGVAGLNAALCGYILMLLRNPAAFYFPAPYRDDHSWLISASAYLPLVLLAAFVPMLFFAVKSRQRQPWSRFAQGLLIANGAVYALLIVLFAYWGLFEVCG